MRRTVDLWIVFVGLYLGARLNMVVRDVEPRIVPLLLYGIACVVMASYVADLREARRTAQ